MSRVNNSVPHRKRVNKIRKQVKGYYGARKNYRNAKQANMKALVYAYFHRRKKKSEFRKLWIVRLNAALRQLDSNYSYSRFINDLNISKYNFNRKTLSNMSIEDWGSFKEVVGKVRAQTI